MLRQRSRPYLFSNSLPPAIVGGALKAIEICREGDDLREKLIDNAKYFRAGMEAAGFDLLPGEHPIIPIMIGDEAEAIKKSEALFDMGVMVIGFGFPVVPKGEARLRVQMSAALTDDHLQQALDAFAKL